MGSRTIAQVAPTSATIALNAYIYGYGGHSLVTPHAAIKQLWWTDERIEAKVTRAFVVSKLRGEERDFLDRPLAFGEGLTDDTYMEWILEKAKRLFLILTEVGIPDQIFGCIDDSWDDDDLPLSLEDVASLELAYEQDETLNQRFYDLQFVFLLREVKEGSHIDYEPREHIPMEHVNSLPPAVTIQMWDRIHFPERPKEIFVRRKYPLIDKETGHDSRETFTRDVTWARALRHEHIAPIWASYTTGDNVAYVLSDFVGEHTLQTFIDHRMPAQWMRVPTRDRSHVLCEWMHCLTDALAFLHHRGASHTAICPSNILIDRDNRIAFADVGSIRTFQKGKKVKKTEFYDYASPESTLTQPCVLSPTNPPSSGVTALNKLRKMSSSSGSSTPSSAGSSSRGNSLCVSATDPLLVPLGGTPDPVKSKPSEGATSSKHSSRIRNFSRHLGHSSSASESHGSDQTRLSTISSFRTNRSSVPFHTQLSNPELEKADIFSLGCIFFDILTFLVKGRNTDFVKFRTTRVAATGSNSKRTDSSFHGMSPELLDAWIRVLLADAPKNRTLIASPLLEHGGIASLLTLARSMMSHNPQFRPTALEVRDQVHEVLVEQCRLADYGKLCCSQRLWEEVTNASSPLIPLTGFPLPSHHHESGMYRVDEYAEHAIVEEDESSRDSEQEKLRNQLSHMNTMASVPEDAEAELQALPHTDGKPVKARRESQKSSSSSILPVAARLGSPRESSPAKFGTSLRKAFSRS